MNFKTTLIEAAFAAWLAVAGMAAFLLMLGNALWETAADGYRPTPVKRAAVIKTE